MSDVLIPTNLSLINLDLIDPNPYQPRKDFAEEQIDELAKSIQQNGLMQPLLVQASGNDRYHLIAGERRLRACKQLGIEKVATIVRPSNNQESLVLALAENLHREDLNVIEKARAYRHLIEEFKLNQDQCAAQLGKDRTTVANTLRLLQLPLSVQEDLRSNRLSMGHGRALLALKDKKEVVDLAKMIIKKDLSVRQTERMCRHLTKTNEPLTEAALDPNLEYLSSVLRDHFRTKVNLAGNHERGRIEICFFSSSELERILTLLNLPS